MHALLNSWNNWVRGACMLSTRGAAHESGVNISNSAVLTWRGGDGGKELEAGPGRDDLRAVAEVQRAALQQGAQRCQHLRRRRTDALHQQPAAVGNRLQAQGRTISDKHNH